MKRHWLQQHVQACTCGAEKRSEHVSGASIHARARWHVLATPRPEAGRPGTTSHTARCGVCETGATAIPVVSCDGVYKWECLRRGVAVEKASPRRVKCAYATTASLRFCSNGGCSRSPRPASQESPWQTRCAQPSRWLMSKRKPARATMPRLLGGAHPKQHSHKGAVFTSQAHALPTTAVHTHPTPLDLQQRSVAHVARRYGVAG